MDGCKAEKMVDKWAYMKVETMAAMLGDSQAG